METATQEAIKETTLQDILSEFNILESEDAVVEVGLYNQKYRRNFNASYTIKPLPNNRMCLEMVIRELKYGVFQEKATSEIEFEPGCFDFSHPLYHPQQIQIRGESPECIKFLAEEIIPVYQAKGYEMKSLKIIK